MKKAELMEFCEKNFDLIEKNLFEIGVLKSLIDELSDKHIHVKQIKNLNEKCRKLKVENEKLLNEIIKLRNV